MAKCSTDDFREKEVINVADGKRLGCVSELEFDICDGKITAIVVLVPAGGLFGGKCRVVIPWDRIDRIGEDVILVNALGCFPPPPPPPKKGCGRI